MVNLLWYVRDLLRNGNERVQLFLTDTVNTLRYAYLTTYVVCLGTALVAGWLGFSGFAAAMCWIGVVACGALSYIFGARLMVIYPMFQRISGTAFNVTGTPAVHTVWYWKAFIAMWVTAPLAAFAVLRPWDAGQVIALFGALFMLLHIVSTQVEPPGKFWRSIYAVGMCCVLTVVVWSIVSPATFDRYVGTYRRTNQIVALDEKHDESLAAKLAPKLEALNADLAVLETERIDYLAQGRPWPVAKVTAKANKEAAVAEIRKQITTLTNNGVTQTIDGGGFSLDPTKFDIGQMKLSTALFWVLAIVGVWFIVRSKSDGHTEHS